MPWPIPPPERMLRSNTNRAQYRPGNEKRKTGHVARFPCPVSRVGSVEARGIEPRSEHDSDTAPTCVDRALWSRYLGAPSALAATSLFHLLRHSLRPQVPPA